MAGEFVNNEAVRNAFCLDPDRTMAVLRDLLPQETLTALEAALVRGTAAAYQAIPDRLLHRRNALVACYGADSRQVADFDAAVDGLSREIAVAEDVAAEIAEVDRRGTVEGGAEVRP